MLDGVCRKEGEREVIEWGGEREGRGRGADRKGQREEALTTLTGKQVFVSTSSHHQRAQEDKLLNSK